MKLSAALPSILAFGITGLLMLNNQLLPVNIAPAESSNLLKTWWSAPDIASRQKEAQNLLKSRVSFDDLWTELRKGYTYSAQVKTGRLQSFRFGSGGKKFHYSFFIPPSYSPNKTYPVEFYLHGAVARPPFSPNEKWWAYEDVLFKNDRISVFPSSWIDAMWWSEHQLDNLEAIRDILKQTYNIDENRIYMIGFSDGGTGVYYLASKRPTPWAAFLPLIGHAAVLANPECGVEGDIFPVNLSNRPFFIVNCGLDHLYPVSSVEPFIKLFRAAGCDIVFRPQPNNGHDHFWWPGEGASIERFKQEHPRTPYPERLVWETENPTVSGRIHWITVDKLGSVKGETPLSDINHLTLSGAGNSRGIFPRTHEHGRVEIERKKNIVTARTCGIKSFTLLLSPDCFDFSQPIKVIVNGVEACSARVSPDAAILLKWAARDNDRSMLFAAELTVNVKGKE